MLLKTRIAPTPSGYLHIGNAFSFVLTSLLAQLSGSSILLRIDDLDRQRYRKEYVDDIFRVLNLLGITWEEGPQTVEDFERNYSQLHRLDLYHAALDQILQQDKAFACCCSRKEVDQTTLTGGYPGTCRTKALNFDSPDMAWRFKTDNSLITLYDWHGNKSRHPLPETMSEFVIRRKEGIPAYQLASVVDDIYFGINRMVRGADLYNSSLAQVQLATIMGKKDFESVRIFHHPLLMDAKGHKLSKSQNSKSLIHGNFSSKEIYQLIGKYLNIPANLYSLADMLDYCQQQNVDLTTSIWSNLRASSSI